MTMLTEVHQERGHPGSRPADTRDMPELADPHRALLAALWYGALLAHLGRAAPWPRELDELAERYFAAFRPRVRA